MEEETRKLAGSWSWIEKKTKKNNVGGLILHNSRGKPFSVANLVSHLTLLFVMNAYHHRYFGG